MKIECMSVENLVFELKTWATALGDNEKIVFEITRSDLLESAFTLKINRRLRNES